jgi:glutamate 5-kinase
MLGLDDHAGVEASVVLGEEAGGAELGRGLAAYSSEEANAIRGRQSEQIESILGYRGRSVMVHRDDLVWFAKDAMAE